MKIPDLFKKEIKMNTGIKNWQASMHSAVRIAVNQNPYDAVNLYLKLEKASKKYLENGEMQEGDTFKVPFETGIMLDISFYKEYSTVKANYPDGKSKVLIDKRDSYKKEYLALETLSDALKSANLGIGPKYSMEFFEIMTKSRPGDVYVFDNNKTFLCTSVVNKYHSFMSVTKNCKTPHIDEFKKQEEFSIDVTNPSSIQDFFRTIKDPYTYDVKMSISSITEARGILNKLIANRDITKELVIGPNKFVAQREKDGKGLVYYDNKGDKISEEKILLLLGWLEANPNKVEIKHLDPITPMKEFTDIMFKRTLDQHLADHEFEAAIDFISGFCMNNQEILQIDMNSYVKSDTEYEATRFVFKFSDGELLIKKLTYEDNDFSKNPISIKNTTAEEVVAYCKQKYSERFNYVKNETLDQIHRDFPEWNSNFFKEMIDKYVELKMKNISVIKANVSYADKNISALMESKFENRKQVKADNENDEENERGINYEL